MGKSVLVAYASKHGGTEEIAERIATVLREAGYQADLRPARQVDDLETYDAVVVGSGVYIGRWRRPAARLLKNHRETLADKPVWLFSSGPTGEGDPVKAAAGWRFPKALQTTADEIGPRDVALFHGALDESELNFIERWMIKNVGAPLGDFRDWDAISAWAESIAEELARPRAFARDRWIPSCLRSRGCGLRGEADETGSWVI